MHTFVIAPVEKIKMAPLILTAMRQWIEFHRGLLLTLLLGTIGIGLASYVIGFIYIFTTSFQIQTYRENAVHLAEEIAAAEVALGRYEVTFRDAYTDILAAMEPIVELRYVRDENVAVLQPFLMPQN